MKRLSCLVVIGVSVFNSSAYAGGRFEQCRQAYPVFAYPEPPPAEGSALPAQRPFGGSNRAMVTFLRQAGVLREPRSVVESPVYDPFAVVPEGPSRGYAEPRFGADFSKVPVHTDPRAVPGAKPAPPPSARASEPVNVAPIAPRVPAEPIVEHPTVAASSPFFRFVSGEADKVLMGIEAAINFERRDKVALGGNDKREILAQLEAWKNSGHLPKPKGLLNLFARAQRSDVFPLTALLKEKGIDTPYDIKVLRDSAGGKTRLLTIVTPDGGNSFSDSGVARLTKSFQDFGFGTVIASPVRIDLNLGESDAKKGFPSLSRAIGTTLEGVNVTAGEIAKARLEFHDELTHRVKFEAFKSIFATALLNAPARQIELKRLREKFIADFGPRERSPSVQSVAQWIKASSGPDELTTALDNLTRSAPKVKVYVASNLKIVVNGREEGKLAIKGNLVVAPTIDSVTGEFAMPTSEWVSYSPEGIKQKTASLSLEVVPGHVDSSFDPAAMRELPARVSTALN